MSVRSIRSGAWLLAASLALVSCEPQEEKAPAARREEVVTLDPAAWVGRSVHEVELARFLDTKALPTDAIWVLYRVDCDRCREHLRELARRFEDDPRLCVLIALREAGDEARRVVDVLPPGERVELPEHLVWNVTAPWELDVDAQGVVRAARVPLQR